MTEFNTEKFKKDIAEKGYVQIDFPLSREEIVQRMNVFIKFLDLPLEEKNKYKYFADEFKGADTGYMRRHREIGSHDNKEFFHYRWGAEDVLADKLKNAPAEVLEMFKVGREIYLVALERLKMIVNVFEKTYPGIYDKFFAKGHPARTALRFLKYDLDQSGDNFLAKGHVDSCALTIAIAESAPGLRMGPGGREVDLVNVEHQPGKAIFFPSRNLGTLTSPADFPGIFHDAEQKADVVFDKQKSIARWALVFFAGYEGMPGKIRMDNPGAEY